MPDRFLSSRDIRVSRLLHADEEDASRFCRSNDQSGQKMFVAILVTNVTPKLLASVTKNRSVIGYLKINAYGKQESYLLTCEIKVHIHLYCYNSLQRMSEPLFTI